MNIVRRMAGFTLIELMITVAVIGILAAIAFPSYEETVRRGKRTEGKSALMDVAARQERYYSDNNTYGALTDLNLANPYLSPDNGYYSITITAGGSASQTFTLSAAPTFTDTTCGTLTLTNTGVKNSSDNAQCWNR